MDKILTASIVIINFITLYADFNIKLLYVYYGKVNFYVIIQKLLQALPRRKTNQYPIKIFFYSPTL